MKGIGLFVLGVCCILLGLAVLFYPIWPIMRDAGFWAMLRTIGTVVGYTFGIAFAVCMFLIGLCCLEDAFHD